MRELRALSTFIIFISVPWLVAGKDRPPFRASELRRRKRFDYTARQCHRASYRDHPMQARCAIN